MLLHSQDHVNCYVNSQPEIFIFVYSLLSPDANWTTLVLTNSSNLIVKNFLSGVNVTEPFFIQLHDNVWLDDAIVICCQDFDKEEIPRSLLSFRQKKLDDTS